MAMLPQPHFIKSICGIKLKDEKIEKFYIYQIINKVERDKYFYSRFAR